MGPEGVPWECVKGCAGQPSAGLNSAVQSTMAGRRENPTPTPRCALYSGAAARDPCATIEEGAVFLSGQFFTEPNGGLFRESLRGPTTTPNKCCGATRRGFVRTLLPRDFSV